MCSISKTFTAVLLLRLAEAGTLSLDRPVLDYVHDRLPERHGLTNGVTLRRLLSHTAGFSRWCPPAAGPQATGLADHVYWTLTLHPRVAPPGTVHDYSNFGIDLAGYIAQVVTGRPFDELAREFVFDPAGMERTTFENGSGTVYPCGSARSTAADMLRFAHLLMDEGRVGARQVLSTESVVAMRTPHASLYLPGEVSRGLAFRLDTYRGARRMGHAGRGACAGSRLRIAPEAGLATIVLIEGGDSRSRERFLPEVENGLFELLLPLSPERAAPAAREPDRTLWPAHVGTYVGNERGLARVEQVGDRLVLDWKGRHSDLCSIGSDTYVGTRYESDPDTLAPSVGFVALPQTTGTTAADAPPPYLMLDGMPLRRVESFDEWQPDPDAWSLLVGSYRHPTLHGARVFVRGERLCIAFDWLGGWMGLTQIGPLDFACRLGPVTFQMQDDRADAFLFRTSCAFTRHSSR